MPARGIDAADCTRPAFVALLVRWYPKPDGAGIKREHGAAYPSGTKTVAAPATVSGECPELPLAKAGKAGQAQRPASQETCRHHPSLALIFYVHTEGVT